jgi:class 3 adenylate cyclase
VNELIQLRQQPSTTEESHVNDRPIQLREAFAAEESRLEVTCLVIDQAGSAGAKEKQPEAAWLSSLGWLFDTVIQIATSIVPNVTIKGIGDGLMLTYSSDEATQAIVTAILIQEAINDANGGPNGTKGKVDFKCYAAIATGKAVSFETPGGGHDFVGSVIDRAHRLCGAANKQAIFIDGDTAAAANMGRISSRVGTALHYAAKDYQGELQRVPVKGFGQPVEYYEILWSQQRYGLLSDTMTDTTDRIAQLRPAETSVPAVSSSQSQRAERHQGEIKCWFPDKKFGFIEDPKTGEEFHFTRNAVVYPEDLEDDISDAQVAFVALDAPAVGKKRRAAGILVVGEDAEGVLVSLPAGRSYGWIRLQDPFGNVHLVYAPMPANASYRLGEALGFRVAINDRGVYAADIARVDQEAA